VAAKSACLVGSRRFSVKSVVLVTPVAARVTDVVEAVRTPKSKQPAQRKEIDAKVERKMAEQDAIEDAKKEGKKMPARTKKKKKSSGCVIS
jgi:hypothetical protein